MLITIYSKDPSFEPIEVDACTIEINDFLIIDYITYKQHVIFLFVKLPLAPKYFLCVDMALSHYGITLMEKMDRIDKNKDESDY